MAHDLAEGQRLRAPAATARAPAAGVSCARGCFGASAPAAAWSARASATASHYPFLEPRAACCSNCAFQTEHLGALERPADVVWDAYVDAQQKVHLLDVAPFHESTDPILFTWPELRAAPAAATGSAPPGPAAADDLLRLVPADAAGGIRPSARMYTGWPVDVLQAGGEDPAALTATAQRAAES